MNAPPFPLFDSLGGVMTQSEIWLQHPRAIDPIFKSQPQLALFSHPCSSKGCPSSMPGLMRRAWPQTLWKTWWKNRLGGEVMGIWSATRAWVLVCLQPRYDVYAVAVGWSYAEINRLCSGVHYLSANMCF